MAKEVFETQDLVRLIYSFGSVEHRKRMYWVADSLVNHRFHRSDKRAGKSLLSPVPNLMKYHKDWHMYLDFFVNKRCRCCSRHSHRKPNIYLKDGTLIFEDGYETRVPEAMNKNDCICGCRRDCRSIIRHFTI